MPARLRRRVSGFCVAGAVAATARAFASDPAPPSDDLLEYPGTSDAESDDWLAVPEVAGVPSPRLAPASPVANGTRPSPGEDGVKASQEQKK